MKNQVWSIIKFVQWINNTKQLINIKFQKGEFDRKVDSFVIFRIARAQLLDTPSTVLKCVYTKENVNKAWKKIFPLKWGAFVLLWKVPQGWDWNVPSSETCLEDGSIGSSVSWKKNPFFVKRSLMFWETWGYQIRFAGQALRIALH